MLSSKNEFIFSTNSVFIIKFFRMETGTAQHGATRVDLVASAAGGGVSLTVTDNGHGISEGNRDQIFTPFFTTTREQGGTGMGLTIAATVLGAHGAGIALLPTAKGAAFALTFGAADQDRRE